MNASDQVIEELRDALAPELLLLERLGGGGMGDVFLARDPALKRNVAVKVLAPHLVQSDRARQRFAREAESAAAVAHPNVVPIHRVGTLPQSRLAYLVMAYVEGGSLRDQVPEGTVASESQARRVVGEVASALAAAHSRGVVHRDIKPGNVMFDPLGGRYVVVDFGIAAVLHRGPDSDGGDGARLTIEGMPVGTPEYMSPEQAAGDTVGAKSDIYSLGCLAYELLTGRPPITGPTPAAVARGHLHYQPVPVESLRSDVSRDFAALVMRCLRKDPDERPDADEVARATGMARKAAVEWPPPGLETLHRLGAQWTRTLGLFALALFAFVLILGIHPAAARPCCADSPDRSPGWLLLKRLSMATPIHFDDPDALAIWYFLLDASFFVALAALVPLALRTAGLARRLLAGHRDGYPLSVLMRVAWDRHRDTGDLLNRTGEYAMVAPAAQAAQLERRQTASAAIALAFATLILTSLLWLGGALDVAPGSATGVLPLGELVLVAALPAALWVTFLVLEAIDLRLRWHPWRPAARPGPLRRDVLDAWLATAGVAAPRQRWAGAAVRGLGIATVLAAALAVAVAAYGLIAVFGASARFAGDRGRAEAWVAAYRNPALPDSSLPRLDRRTALALAAPIPVRDEVTRALTEGRLPPAERRMLAEAIGPAFCLNPREVMFGLSEARMRERGRIGRVAGGGVLEADGDFDIEALSGGGVSGLRRRARFCERHIGAQASISPPARAASQR